MRKFKIGLTIVTLVASGYSAQTLASDTDVIAELRATIASMEQRLVELERAQAEAAQESVATSPSGSAYEPSKLLQVYGQMKVSADTRSGDFANTGTTIASNASRFGVKGSAPTPLEVIDLIYQAEMQYEAAGPSSGPASKEVTFREGFAGFQSPWGKVRVGRLSTPYKTTLTTIDPWTDYALQSRGGGMGGSSELHANFFNNTIEYSTAKSSAGISASMWQAFELTNSGKGLYNTGTLQNFSGGSANGVGLRFTSGPVFLALDRIEIDADNVGLPGLSNGGGWQVAGRYSFKDWSFAAFYEDVQDIGLGKNSYFNGIYRMGMTRLIMAYGQNRDAAAYGNEDVDNWSVGAKFDLTEGSELMLGFNQRTNNTRNLNFNTFTVGINAKFGY